MWLVTRHPGALEWLARRGCGGARHVTHLNPSVVKPGDVVVGTLPVSLIARVVDAGATYYHLVLELPPELRGRELEAGDLERLGARLERYTARRLPR